MKPGTKEYHALKSKECYHRKRQDPEWLKQKAIYRRDNCRKNKAKAVDQFGGICHHCGNSYPQCVFEFHHLNPDEKEYTPAVMFGRRWETISRELSKCIMLCANCHRLEHERLKKNELFF